MMDNWARISESLTVSDMDMKELGRTGLVVSRLCFGTGLLGRLKHNFSYERGAELLLFAFERGVNFWDTAINYGSHGHVQAALARVDRSEIIINSKTSKRSYPDGKEEIDRALDEMDTDYIDSMMLHAVSDPADYESRAGCLEALMEAKAEGRIRHVGASSHIYTGRVLSTLTEAPEIEVVLSHLNKEGKGLEGGSLESHMALLRHLREAGKGLMIMKILDQGSAPEPEVQEWIKWGFEYPYADSVDLGMNNEDEIEMSVRLSSRVPVA